MSAAVQEALLLEENLRRCFRAMASTRPNADVRDIAGISIASAGAAFQMFNAAFLAPPAASTQADLERRVATAEVHFNARGISWSFWACEALAEPGLRGRLRRTFERRGLDLGVELPGMIAEKIRPPRRRLPGLEVRRVDCERERLAFCDIGSVCFRVPLNWFREIFLFEPVWEDFRGWVGYSNGEPVTTAGAVISPEVIGIYNVATLPGMRRRGFGEALMRRAIDELRNETGIDRWILQSTDYGYSLYESMGFRTVTKVAVFTSLY